MSAAADVRGAAQITAAISGGDLRSAARLITRIEAADEAAAPVLAQLYARGGSTPIVGLTGPPGAGKSTLVDQMLAQYRAAGERVAVLAVDPSSPFSGGAILGDRVRMGRHNTDPGVFIRSMAARGRLGGLALAAADALTVLDAMGWDRILIETVGVGQNEIEILRHADTVIIVQTPAGGDAVQAVKAGILEVGDLFVVNKADTAGADRTVAALREAVEFRTHALGAEAWQPPVLKTEAAGGVGIRELLQAIDAHHQHFRDHPKQFAARRRSQARARLVECMAAALRARRGDDEQHDIFDDTIDDVVARRCDPQTAAKRLVDSMS
ncbi:MAG: transport system ATPase [Hydrocarboniphaga sp.]|uniref:methylmalonyl Co-A mutase-associated GTPase MeaB n=1 Tax=Hydrocarboniphaga sp. TaxID=2033016 RepID=UPI002605248F|nr:methylmalonyl Co-A mutase-associated GTPase MeaB [Hydrocarboniphaga sp.]MDB5971501.1 transport system ATPase [Hydrocarboniphaga sp.]